MSSAGFAPAILAIELPQTCALNGRANGIGHKHLALYYSIILHTITRRKANWIGHILCSNWLIKHVIEGKRKGKLEMGKRGRRRKQLLDDLKESRGYWKLKDETLDRTVWRTRFWKRLWTCLKADCGMN
jgi:hypothetical protein